MAFHDVRFPDDIAIGATGGPGFSTEVVTLRSGREKRNVNWAEARGRWDVAHGLKDQGQLDRLVAFFRARRGRAHAFRFKDWTDFRLPRQAIGEGDGATAAFPLVKSYGDDGGYSAPRRITRPVAGTVRLWLAGVEQQTGFTVDHTAGVVTFAAPPAAGATVEAEAEFDVPARFDTDQMKVSVEAYDAFRWGQIPIVEVRE